jgi:hypothetical protein
MTMRAAPTMLRKGVMFEMLSSAVLYGMCESGW